MHCVKNLLKCKGALDLRLMIEDLRMAIKQQGIKELLTRRVAEVIDRAHLEKQLVNGKKLRVKLGIDPNRPDLHLGHAVPLMKLREFQEAGHTAVLIIGDWTAMIGDPSGRDETRPALSEKAVKQNARAYFKQAYLVLDRRKTEIHLQSEWFANLGIKDLIRLGSCVSMGEMLSHETFRKRLKENLPFAFYESFYPLLQGYDSVAVKADVELGATEQKFNVLMGRKVQKFYGQAQQDVMLMPYLIGLDGKEKMSKSLDNYIALQDSPTEMFGKIMSLPDSLIAHYFELCTFLSPEELQRINLQLASGKSNPKQIKMKLADQIVEFYHGHKPSAAAEEDFENKYGKSNGEIIPNFTLKKKAGSYLLIEILVEGKLAGSRSEARRKLTEGAVEVAGKKITDPGGKVSVTPGAIIRLGKRFLRIE